MSNLLPGNAHTGVDISKDCWLNEVSLVSNTSSTTHQLSSLRLAGLYQLQNLFHLNVVHLVQTHRTSRIHRNIIYTFLTIAEYSTSSRKVLHKS